MSTKTKIMRIRTSSSGTSIRDSTNNGMSSTLMNTQKSQRRVNSMKPSDSMLKDHSTLSQPYQLTDISI